MAADFEPIQELFNELESFVKRAKGELAKYLNTASTDAHDEAIKAAGDSADTTAASTTDDTPGEPVGSDSSPEVSGEITDTTGDTPEETPAETPATDTTDVENTTETPES